VIWLNICIYMYRWQRKMKLVLDYIVFRQVLPLVLVPKRGSVELRYNICFFWKHSFSCFLLGETTRDATETEARLSCHRCNSGKSMFFLELQKELARRDGRRCKKIKKRTVYLKGQRRIPKMCQNTHLLLILMLSKTTTSQT
jgi:hypothetical protein